MDVKSFRRLFRVLFFIGAMIVCFGLGFYLMEMESLGISLIIAGVAVLVISFSMTKFFLLYDLRNPSRGRK